MGEGEYNFLNTQVFFKGISTLNSGMACEVLWEHEDTYVWAACKLEPPRNRYSVKTRRSQICVQCECLRLEAHELITFVNKTHTQSTNILYWQLLDSNLFINVSQKYMD